MKPTLVLIPVLLLTSCAQKQEQNVQATIDLQPEIEVRQKLPPDKQSQTNYSHYEQELIKQGFLDVEELGDIQTDIRYTTANNFTGEVLYDSLQHAFLRPVAYEQLKQALANLQKKHPNYGFLVFDALRPNHVQYKMWDIVKGTEQERYVANPYSGSIHNYGCAIDLTIFDKKTGAILPMGSDYDYFGPAAEYRYNEQLLQEGRLTEEEVTNRKLLRQVMRQAGFHSIDTEWWHFNALSRSDTRATYKMVK